MQRQPCYQMRFGLFWMRHGGHTCAQQAPQGTPQALQVPQAVIILLQHKKTKPNNRKKETSFTSHLEYLSTNGTNMLEIVSALGCSTYRWEQWVQPLGATHRFFLIGKKLCHPVIRLIFRHKERVHWPLQLVVALRGMALPPS